MKTLLVLIATAMLGNACDQARQATPGATAMAAQAGEHEHHDHQEMEAATPLPGTSIYNLPGDWQTADGRTQTLAELRGKPRVLAFIYTSCEQVCPLIVEDVKRVEKALSKKSLEHLGFVLVTFDPEVDTPEKLKAYQKQHKLDPDRWTLLRGDPKRVRELAAVLGVRYQKLADNDFAHSNTITLVDQEGTIVQQRARLDEPLELLIAAVKASVKE